MELILSCDYALFQDHGAASHNCNNIYEIYFLWLNKSNNELWLVYHHIMSIL